MEFPREEPAGKPYDLGRLPFERGIEGRLAAGCVAIPFAVLAFWMWWIVHSYLNGNSWFDFIAALVIEQVIAGAGLIASAFMIWAMFAPSWMPKYFNWALTKALIGIAVFVVFAIMPGCLLAAWGSLSAWLSIVW